MTQVPDRVPKTFYVTFHEEEILPTDSCSESKEDFRVILLSSYRRFYTLLYFPIKYKKEKSLYT